MDEDDAESHGITHPGIDIVKVIKAAGKAARRHPERRVRRVFGQYVLLMNDDAVYRTQGWDRALAEAFERFPDDVALVYGNDLDQGKKVPTFPALSRKACEIMRGVCPAQYLNLHIESHMMDIFRRLKALGHDRIVYLKDVVFEHLHHTLGKSAEDKTSKKKDPDFDDWQFLCLDEEREKTAVRMAAYIQRRAVEKTRGGEAGEDVSVPRNYQSLSSELILNLSLNGLTGLWKPIAISKYCIAKAPLTIAYLPRKANLSHSQAAR